ncbi:MAG: hypothetical protein MJK08_00370 [Campylobacterales bacterium]|nr:hypothetical protein [Campylobacterales bacterium]
MKTMLTKKFPSQKEIVDSVITGIKTAKENFTHWTADELYLSYAPAKFLTIHVSQEIGKLENSPELFMDASVADILRCSLENREDFREYMKKNSLSDEKICLTLDERFEHKSDNDSISRVIMALRNGVRNVNEINLKEIEKICILLNKSNKDESTLDYGIFAFYLDISVSARKKAKIRLNEIIKSFNKVVDKYPNLKSNFKGGEINIIENIGEWCVACYIIEPTLD